MEKESDLTKEMSIIGCVSRVDGMPISEAAFWRQLTTWFEENGYAFGGSIDAYSEETERPSEKEIANVAWLSISEKEGASNTGIDATKTWIAAIEWYRSRTKTDI